MSNSLHGATVGAFRQGLGSLLHLLNKAEEHASSQDFAADDILTWRLIDDMQPFLFQCTNASHLSAGALKAIETGTAIPDPAPAPANFGELKVRVAEALAAVESYDEQRIAELSDRDVMFEAGEIRLPFTVSDFLLTFAIPNFYFHLTTAYALLRQHGVQIGKLDFLGQIRIKAG